MNNWIRQILLAGIFGLIFFLLLDILMWVFPPNRGMAFWKWDSSGPIAIGDHYSVELLTRPASMIGMAEYDQRLVLYGGTEREGDELGTIDLHMNTGGRTHVLLYRIADEKGGLLLVDRFGQHRLDLKEIKYEPYYEKQIDTILFLGTVSDESYPLKFVPTNVWNENESKKKE